MPATVCVGFCFQPLSYQKQTLMLRLSSCSLVEISFSCQFWFCTSFHDFSSRHFLSSTLGFPAGITSPLSCCMQVGFGYSSCNWRPSSSAYLAASLTNELLPNSIALSSSSRTIAIAGSPFLYNFTAALIFVTLHSSSIEHRPLPPIFLGMYRIAVQPQGCFPPIFSTIILRASRSIFFSCHRPVLCPHQVS